MDLLTYLFDHAEEAEAEMLHDLLERAKLLWECEGCLWHNFRHAAKCKRCSHPRPPDVRSAPYLEIRLGKRQIQHRFRLDEPELTFLPVGSVP